eukprot:574743-Rhodomonas_salina.1
MAREFITAQDDSDAATLNLIPFHPRLLLRPRPLLLRPPLLSPCSCRFPPPPITVTTLTKHPQTLPGIINGARAPLSLHAWNARAPQASSQPASQPAKTNTPWVKMGGDRTCTCPLGCQPARG